MGNSSGAIWLWKQHSLGVDFSLRPLGQGSSPIILRTEKSWPEPGERGWEPLLAT